MKKIILVLVLPAILSSCSFKTKKQEAKTTDEVSYLDFLYEIKPKNAYQVPLSTFETYSYEVVTEGFEELGWYPSDEYITGTMEFYYNRDGTYIYEPSPFPDFGRKPLWLTYETYQDKEFLKELHSENYEFSFYFNPMRFIKRDLLLHPMATEILYSIGTTEIIFDENGWATYYKSVSKRKYYLNADGRVAYQTITEITEYVHTY